MPTYKIRGIDVDFPFEAYDCQLVYMEKVIQSLQEKRNALLESPTGTGKTLCLLCATLAWRKSLGPFSSGRSKKVGHDDDPSSQSDSGLPTIVYTSRTHSQLHQVIQELKCSSYRPKMVVLGSREQLCIHEQVSLLRGKAQTNACHLLCRRRLKRFCSHFSRVTDFIKENPGLGDEPVDIEDLVNIGKSCGPCPYYVSRELHKGADILFAPYNYLIDRGNRKTISVNWNNSILIFDEAHNLESLCADAASFELPSTLLTACISEAKSCMDLSTKRRDISNDKSCDPENFAILKALLLKLEKRISEVPIVSKEFGFTKPGPYIYEFLDDLNITETTANKVIDIIEEAALLLEEEAGSSNNGAPQKIKGITCRLESMGDILRIIFRDQGTSHAQYYRVHVREVESSATSTFVGKTSRTLSWWCFNPGIAMEEFAKLGVGSIILTSGTLSPMDSFAQEFKLEFPIRLENPHVISSNQLWAGVVSTGPSGYPFNSSYRCRDSIEYKQELGNAIVNFARIVPDGLLVFFPSYYLMDQCIGYWKSMENKSSTNSTTIWERICHHKQAVVEPRESSLFPSSMADYRDKLKDRTSGAVFFAVCRGKVSEGLDFADHAGRAVVVTGMPFATRTDPKVRLKREYLDRYERPQEIGCKGLTGEEWYNQQAARAVNQAVGRVIRHRHDYGAIIFCDERFAHPSRQSQISLWIQPNVKCHAKFGDVVFTLTRFFRDKGGKHNSTKLELAQIKDQGTPKRLQSSQPNDLHLASLLAPLTAQLDPNTSTKLSSGCDAKKRSSFARLADVLPANRSSLTSNSHKKKLSVKASSDLLACGLKSTQSMDSNIIDLASDSSIYEERSQEIIGASFSSKKLKLESDPAMNCNDVMNANKRIDVRSTSGPSCQEDGKGSTFLAQVQAKLNGDEYKDFVDSMKALKSKTMNISTVLQSIATLFSHPDRLPLLRRFKDFIPSKYHALYEEILSQTKVVSL
ncbi:regulator of telomere elongation helicase 1 homolog [Impatiens glandulifera]|uniref:regulator of telomere elongation helicase 1 homolog n=1 Tax=Impatiens glandulifera TaxID=253017 RepID=UPI001FB0A034|nr:regulator of telomere elongation helicase 1 homolog [Impatiens glandulifera]